MNMKSKKMSEGLEAEMKALREEMRALREKIGTPLPELLSMGDAAKRLGVSLTKLKGLVRIGDVRTVELGGRRMIPDSEIRRVCTPASRPETTKRQRVESPKSKAEKMRERLRRERA